MDPFYTATKPRSRGATWSIFAPALILATAPHDYWEKFIAPRVRDKIVSDLKAVDPNLVPHSGNKVGGIKNFHSLAPQAQTAGLALGKLKGHINSGYYAQVDEAELEFSRLATEMLRRMGYKAL